MNVLTLKCGRNRALVRGRMATLVPGSGRIGRSKIGIAMLRVEQESRSRINISFFNSWI